MSGTSKPRVRIIEIVTDNGVVSDEASIANELNKYFVNFLEQICKDNEAGIEFDNTKLKQTIDIIEKISSNKAVWVRWRKCASSQENCTGICKSIMQNSISANSTVLLNNWKIAKVTPLHKGGARNDINNYRPISALPACLHKDSRKTRSQLPF